MLKVRFYGVCQGERAILASMASLDQVEMENFLGKIGDLAVEA